MSSRIEVGDTVMVAYPQPCCGETKFMGQIFKVSRIEHAKLWCTSCKKNYLRTGVIGEKVCHDELTLIKLPPITEEEKKHDLASA